MNTLDKKQIIYSLIMALSEMEFTLEADILLWLRSQSSWLFSLYLSSRDHSMVPLQHNSDQWIIDYSRNHFFLCFEWIHCTLYYLEEALWRVDEGGTFKKPHTGGHYPVENILQVLIFICYMATQETLFAIGKRFRVCASTVHNIVNRLLYLILLLKKKFIRFPSNQEELMAVSRELQKYPDVVGALDGTHIFIKIEKGEQDSYIDRYRRHSINIMAISSASRIFLYVFVGFPASAHDSRFFENSNLFKDVIKYGSHSIFDKYHLVGDSAFGVREWLMTPYRDNNNLTRKQKHHNYCLSSERVVIEHTFGLLKGRWRRLQYINTYNIFKAIEIATAGCILHNFCYLRNDTCEEEFEDARVPLQVLGEEEGKNKRDGIADRLFQNRNV